MSFYVVLVPVCLFCFSNHLENYSEARQKLKNYNKNGTAVLQSEDEGPTAKRRRTKTKYV